MAFRALLGKYERAVYSICLRMVRNRDEAADLAQESFVKVFSMLDRYNPSYAFSSWPFKITSNLCIDHLRKRRIETFAMDEPIDGEKGEIQRQYEAPDLDPEQEYIRKEKMQRLVEAINEDFVRIIMRIQVVREQETPAVPRDVAYVAPTEASIFAGGARDVAANQAAAERAASAQAVASSSTDQADAAEAHRTGGKARTVVKDKDDPYANVGRNDPCPCGSGKKYKKCHGAA